jgi:hypothetical protein
MDALGVPDFAGLTSTVVWTGEVVGGFLSDEAAFDDDGSFVMAGGAADGAVAATLAGLTFAASMAFGASVEGAESVFAAGAGFASPLILMEATWSFCTTAKP